MKTFGLNQCEVSGQLCCQGQLCASIFLMLVSMFLCVSAHAGGPAKIAISADKSSVWTGSQTQLDVQLVDPDNQPADSSKRWDLTLDIISPGGQITSQTLVMQPGEHSKTISLPVNEAGIWKIQAKDKELFEAAIVLNAMDPPTERGTSGDGEVSIEDLLAARLGIVPQVELRITPQRKLLADGKDSATVYGLLSGDAAIATEDIKLRLHHSDGSMEPAEVLIAKGEFSGSATLVSDHPGEVAVEYLGALPAAKLIGPETLSVKFGAPITKMAAKASPPQISLLATSEVVVRLMSSAGIPLATDEARDVSLTIEKGDGQLDVKEFTIAAGSAEGRASFKPTAVGEVVLAAASPNLLSVQVPLTVTWPVLLLMASALGGSAGGLLAFAIEKTAKWWRIAIGLLTGFVLYWAAIFVGIDAIAGGVALNPLSAFVISVIGGWAGTKVFTPLLKRMGLPN